MRTDIINNGEFKFRYPDSYCFCFNPNYLDIVSDNVSSLTIEVAFYYNGKKIRSNTISVSLYQSEAKVYLSKLFELMFEEPENTRSLPITVSIMSDNGNVTYFSFTSIVFWGSLAPGRRFDIFGVFDGNPSKPYFERTIVWYKNLPFNITIFKYDNDINASAYIDGSATKVNVSLRRSAKTISSIDKFMSPVISSGYCPNPEKLIYFITINKILAKLGTNYYTNWGGSTGFDLPSALVDSENKPIKAIDYHIEDKNGLVWTYRYDGLTLCNEGLYQNSCFYTFNPENYFKSAKHKVSITYNIYDGGILFSVFDHTFDYTFGTIEGAGSSSMINLIISEETSGHYLRWVDGQGALQYFLFHKGTKTEKTTLGKDTLEIDYPLNGMYFHDFARHKDIEITESIKCGATSLPQEIYSWVRSIITSPLIDLYIGKDIYGNELWVPVRIQASSFDYDYKKMLHDIEIILTLPPYQPQKF